jgi:tRNA pseudouridine55 synthase
MKSKFQRQLDGVLLLDKATDASSNKVLQQVKRLFQANKAGHCGTLDPLATGMLPICFGQATKYSQYVLDGDKTYLATGQLGVTTTTGDSEGDVVSKLDVFRVTKAQLLMALSNYNGPIQQTPPMYSALKHKGQPLYKLARKGEIVERKPRDVVIHDLELLAFDGKQFQIKVRCSKGTYIRTLVEDIGNDLQVGGHITALRRLAAAPFSLTDTLYSYDQLQSILEKEPEALDACLLPMESLLVSLPVIRLPLDQEEQLRKTKSLYLSPYIEGKVRFQNESGKFLGAGELDAEGQVLNRRLTRDV